MSIVDWHSPLGIVVIALFAISCLLYLIGMFKHERHLSPREAVDLLKSRKQYLPLLKSCVINKTKQLEHIRDWAADLSFSEYMDKYVSNRSKLSVKDNGLFFVFREYALIGFKVGMAMGNNLYYEDLKRTDRVLLPLDTNYDLLIPQVKDKKLKKHLNEHWDIVDKNNSRIIFESMMSTIGTLSPMRKMMVIIVDKFYSRKLKSASIEKVTDRIDDLLYGVSDT